MSAVLDSKAEVIDEILPIRDLLKEHHEKLAAQPRSTTASRQLATIITKLEGWHQAFTLRPVRPEPPPHIPTREELLSELEETIDRKLSLLRR